MKTKVILFDLWETLITSLPEDPAFTLQRKLRNQHETAGLDKAFVRFCVTTDRSYPADFLAAVSKRFDLPITRETKEWFAWLLVRERNGIRIFDDTVSTLKRLRMQGYRLGVISNLWPFPVDKVFAVHGLGRYFDELFLSYALRSAKPEPDMFFAAAERFDVALDECVMVGDGPGSDIAGARGVDMPCLLLDRKGVASANAPHGVKVIRSLAELRV